MNFNHQARPTSLYIHWPFCPYRCNFCPFIALSGHEEYMAIYHKSLLTEMQEFFGHYDEKITIETIYMGGGTPSTYPLPLLLDMFDTIKNATEFTHDVEISIEVNPATASSEHVKVWKEMGINRVSIGVQSLNEALLNKLNRHQKTSDVLSILTLVDQHFKTKSVDFILGLPEVSSADWKSSIEKIVQWPINHCSIYFLMVHEQTPLYFDVKKKRIQLPIDDEIVDLYYWTIEYLQRFGFFQYELSSFAKTGNQSKHNKAYWNRKPFKGFGLGAWSFDGFARMQNEKNLMKYIEGMEKQGDIIIFNEKLSARQAWNEQIMLGLRQKDGILLEILLAGLDDKEKKTFNEQIALLVQRGLLTNNQERIALTQKAYVLEHEVISSLSINI